MLFLVEDSHFGRPKTNFSCFGKWKAKRQTNKQRQKTKVLSSFCNFSSYFQFSTFPFFDFPFLHFPSFPSLSFPSRLAEISRWEVSGGHPWLLCYWWSYVFLLTFDLTLTKNHNLQRDQKTMLSWILHIPYVLFARYDKSTNKEVFYLHALFTCKSICHSINIIYYNTYIWITDPVQEQVKHM